jgi:hypothetical protein
MIWALFQKDLRLLRICLRFFVGALLLCFFIAGAITIAYLEETEKIWDESTAVIAATLSGGSFLGISTSIVFAALFSGSAVTLERSDRSSQFLAYLPPTRFQIFSSKLMVVSSVVSISFCFCLFTWFLANRLLYGELMAADMNSELSMGSEAETSVMRDSLFLWFALIWDDVILHPFIAAITSVVGCSLLTSLWSTSNAGPTIYGVVTPIVIFLSFSGVMITWFPDLSNEVSMMAFSIVTSSIGLGCTIAAVCVYLIQREY